jgi:ribosome-binding protein aMBF1 (putative translation factor)
MLIMDCLCKAGACDPLFGPGNQAGRLVINLVGPSNLPRSPGPSFSVWKRYWIDSQMVLVPHAQKRKWRILADNGAEFFIRPTIQAAPAIGFPEFFRKDRDGRPRSVVHVARQTEHEGFRQALAKVDRETTGKRAVAVRGSYEGVIQQLADEIREYDELKSGGLSLPNVERLDQIAPLVTKMRIAKGVSQTELARRLGVSKQVISRYEETDYKTVAISRLQQILDAIGIKALVKLMA